MPVAMPFVHAHPSTIVLVATGSTLTSIEFTGEHGNLPALRPSQLTALTSTVAPAVTTLTHGNKVPVTCSNRGNCGTYHCMSLFAVAKCLVACPGF